MNSVAFIPNGLRYLVLPDPIEDESETIGGVTISTKADPNKKASEGTVVAVGEALEERVMVDGSQRIYTRFCRYPVSAKLIYGQYAGYEQEFDKVKYKVLAESEILGERVRYIPEFGVGASGHNLIDATGPDEPSNRFPF
jgi:co-chaperonin GroES (HSP10)